MKNIFKYTLPTIGLSLLLTGCGRDEEAQKQISELQDRLLSLEQEVKGLKESSSKSQIQDNFESLKYLKPRVEKMETDLQELIHGLASDSPIQTTTKPFQTPEELKTAQASLASRDLSLEHKKTIALIRAYLSNKPLSSIPEILNSRGSLHPDDGSKWDVQKLTRFIEFHKIPKTSSK